MTGCVKINPNCTKPEIHFIAEHYTFTLALPRIPYTWLQMAKSAFTAFCHPCKTTKVYDRVFGSVNGINKDVSGARLLPTTVLTILWIESVSVTDWIHGTALCALMEGIICLQLLTHPNTLHPPPTHPCPKSDIHDVTFAVKKLLKFQQC